jgi:hypothetical protein
MSKTRPPLIIGIDPGVTGAIAFTCGSYSSVEDLPVTTRTFLKNQSKCLNTIALYEKLNYYAPCKVCDYDQVILATEQMQNMGSLTPPKVLTMLSEMAGTIEATMRIWCWNKDLPLFVRKYQPKTWTHWMFPDSDKRTGRKAEAKEESRQAALRLFPALADQLKLKKHSDRAEALLLSFVSIAELFYCNVDPTIKKYHELIERYRHYAQDSPHHPATFTALTDSGVMKQYSSRIMDEITKRKILGRPTLDASHQ